MYIEDFFWAEFIVNQWQHWKLWEKNTLCGRPPCGDIMVVTSSSSSHQHHQHPRPSWGDISPRSSYHSHGWNCQMKTWIIVFSDGSVMNTDSYHLFHQCHCVPSNAIIPHNIARRAQYMSNNRFSMPPHVSKKRLTTMQHQRWHRRKLTPRLWAQQQDPVPTIDSVHSTTILFVISKSS